MSSSSLCAALALLLCTRAFGALQSSDSAFSTAFQDVQRRHERRLLFTPWTRALPTRNTGQFKGLPSNDEECEWSDEEGKCFPSEVGLSALLDKTGSAYGHLISQFFGCDHAKDSDSCSAAGNCFWAEKQGVCMFVAVTEGYDDSPVVKAAPLSVEYFADTIQCPLLDAKACYDQPHCAWDSDEETCSLELSRLYFGISSDDIAQALQDVVFQVKQKFELIAGAPDFKVESLLDWEIPETECQGGMSQAACDFAHAVAGGLIPVSFYCQLKHSGFFGFTGCLNDPLCHFDIQQFLCMHRSTQLEFALGKAYEASSASVEHVGDKEFLVKLGQCLQQVSEDTCTGDCMWFEVEAQAGCSPRTDAFFRMIAAPGKEGSDPLYYFFSGLADSDCFDSEDKESCSANPRCLWSEAGESCSVSYAYLLITVFSVDSDAEEAYSQLTSDCLEYGTSDDCTGSAEPAGSAVY